MSEPQVSGAPSRRLRGWIEGLGMLLLAAGGAVMVLTTMDRPNLPVHGALEGEVLLSGSDGKLFSTQALRGKVWAAGFIFTNCRDTCPCITAHMILVQDAILADARLLEGARLVSFSVDPERDTPQELGRFAERYGADRRVWSFLTGGEGQVAKLAKEVFRLSASSEEEIVHSDRLSLVDALGRVRGYYRPEPADVKRLVRDMKRLVSEGSGLEERG